MSNLSDVLSLAKRADISITMVARMLEVSRATLYKWIDNEELISPDWDSVIVNTKHILQTCLAKQILPASKTDLMWRGIQYQLYLRS